MSSALHVNVLAVGRGRLERWEHDGLARPYWRIYHNFDAGWRIEWSGGRDAMTPDRLLVIPPEARYRGVGEVAARHLFTHLTIDGLPPAAPHPIVLPVRDGLASLIANLQASTERIPRLPAAALALAALARVPAGLFAAPAHSARIAAAIAFANERLPLPVSVDQLARVAGMHATAFIRRFRTETGVTPHAWQVRARIEQACLALERDDASIDVIAERFGFCDRSHFSRCFTRLRGVGPGAYRRAAVPQLTG